MRPVGVMKKAKKEKKQRRDISRMRLDHTRRATTTKFGLWGGVTDIINHAKFHAKQYIGFGFLRGRNLPFFYAFLCSPSAMAYTTGLGYLPTRDYIWI